MHIDCPINPTVHFFSLEKTKQKSSTSLDFPQISGFEPKNSLSLNWDTLDLYVYRMTAFLKTDVTSKTKQ